MGLFDNLRGGSSDGSTLDLRGIIGGETVACEKCREERNKRVEMESTTTWDPRLGAEVSSFECPDCGHSVMREEGGEVRLSHGEFADGDDWESLR